MMTDRPILFTGPMVRALIDGTKTQTRRIMKPPYGIFEVENGKLKPICRSPVVGDRLWVKETHFAYGCWITTDKLTKTGKHKRIFVRAWDVGVSFRKRARTLANSDTDEGWYERNSLFMHKCDSRLTLAVTDVRVQRLQDISEADAIAEGVERVGTYANLPHYRDYINGDDEGPHDPIDSFHSLWDGINTKTGTAWADNPWVVVYSFDVHQRNIDRMGDQ